MIQIVKADGAAERAVMDAMKARAAQANQAIDAAAAEIMETVKVKGFEAVRDYSLRFDKAEPREITPAELDAAYNRCPKELIAALERAAANIKDYNEKLLTRTMEWTSPDGGVVGRVVRGLTRVGIYVPGGTAAYPSSVLMNAVPAKVAGVEEIVMVTPPTENLNDAVLAAAKIAGVDRVIAVGGAQAVAALTYGAGFIPRVDKLVGPGNAFVAAAKRQAYGKLDIDMVAGPSEVLVIADGKANPKFVAADLLSQAEHDKLASAVLLTDSMELAQAVDAEIIRQTGYLSRSEIMECSLRDFGCAIVCGTLDDCAALANEIAGQRDRSGAPGDRHRGSPGSAALHQKRRGGVPGCLVPGALGGLPGRARPRAAHQRHRPVLLAPQRGQLPQDHEHHPVRPGQPGPHQGPDHHPGPERKTHRPRQFHPGAV